MVVAEDLGAPGGAGGGGLRSGGGRALAAEPRERFAVADDLPRERHAYAARMELAMRGMLADGGYAGFTFHFDSIGGDGRFEQLPLLAASNLMADGYGFAAEGDVNTASLMCAAQVLPGDCALLGDVRDGLGARLAADQPHGRGQLADRTLATGRSG